MTAPTKYSPLRMGVAVHSTGMWVPEIKIDTAESGCH